jgi:hypothetical protein
MKGSNPFFFVRAASLPACPFFTIPPGISFTQKWIMADKIRRNHVLKILDVKSNPDGSPCTFSMVFVKKNGERVFVPRAISCGLPYSLSAHRLRGVMPVDSKGNKNGHVYPVNIDLILEFNSMEVVL